MLTTEYLERIGLLRLWDDDAGALSPALIHGRSPPPGPLPRREGGDSAAAVETDGDDGDEDVLFEAEIEGSGGKGQRVRVPCRVENEFFRANFAVTSMRPSFSVEILLLGPCGAPLALDAGAPAAADGAAASTLTLEGLDAARAHGVARSLEGLGGVRMEAFLGAEAACDSASAARRDVPSVAALSDACRAAAGCGGRWRLPEGLADPKEAVCCYFDALCDAVRPPPTEFLSLVQVEEVLPCIFCIEANSSFILGKLFLRAQEYYECPDPRFRRQRFTLAQYRAWCRDKDAGGEGGFRYYVTWPGFNIPSWVLADLRAGALGPLEPWEEALLAAVPATAGGRPFYVIGTSERDPLTLRHELAHGLWTTDAGYRAAAGELLGTLSGPQRSSIRVRLIDMGYADDDDIIEDETQAYMCEGNTLGSDRKDLCDELAIVFKRFAGES